ETQNFFSGAIQKDDATLEVGSQQTAAHRVNDVFGEVLEIEQLLAFFFEFNALASQGLGKKAGEVGNGQEAEAVAEEPGPQAAGEWRVKVGPRSHTEIGERAHGGQQCRAQGCDGERSPTRKQDTGDDND